MFFCTYCWTNVLLWWWQDCEQPSCVSDSLCGASYHKHKRLNDMLLMNTHTRTFSLEKWTNRNQQQQQQPRSSTVRLIFLSVIFFNECWLCCPCDHVSVCVERIDVRWPYFEQTSNVSPTRFIPLHLSFFHQKWILKISQNIFYEVRQIAKGRSEEQRSKAGSPNRKCVRQKNTLSVKQWRRYE